jgi:hypothetical protein
MAQERILNKSAGGDFNAAVQPYQPRGQFYKVSFAKGTKAVYTKSDNHANKATKGEWRDVRIETPDGKVSRFNNVESLKKRTETLAAAGYPYADDFQDALQKYESLNLAQPNLARPTMKQGFAATH